MLGWYVLEQIAPPQPSRTYRRLRSRRRFFFGRKPGSGQCTHDGDLAAAARLAGQDFDPIDKRADGFDNLRACCLVLQRLLESPDLFTIELRQIGVDNDFHIVLLGRQISLDVSLASLQAPQLIAQRVLGNERLIDEFAAEFKRELARLRKEGNASKGRLLKELQDVERGIKRCLDFIIGSDGDPGEYPSARPRHAVRVRLPRSRDQHCRCSSHDVSAAHTVLARIRR
jgi:hypothetical protein